MTHGVGSDATAEEITQFLFDTLNITKLANTCIMLCITSFGTLRWIESRVWKVGSEISECILSLYSLVPSTHVGQLTTPYNFSSRGSDTSLDLQGHLPSQPHTHTDAQTHNETCKQILKKSGQAYKQLKCSLGGGGAPRLLNDNQTENKEQHRLCSVLAFLDANR